MFDVFMIILTNYHDIWCLLATGTPCRQHKMALSHMDLIKINVENPNTIPGIPVKTI